MVELLAWLEASPLGQGVRGAGVWSYAVINLVHIAGVATLFGAILVLDLRMLGLFRRVPPGFLSVPTVPLAAAGFTLAAISGLCLLATQATEYQGNPFLLVKFGAIFVALANLWLLHRSAAWRHRWNDARPPQEARRLALGGGVSIIAWTAALAAGRMIGYW